MKCSEVKVTLPAQDARRAAVFRLCNQEDDSITTPQEVDEYKGPTFIENGEDTTDLHILYRDGMACINFENEDGVRVNYDYPINSVKRISHKANEYNNSNIRPDTFSTNGMRPNALWM